MNMQDKNVIIYKSLLIPVSGAFKVSSTLSGQLTITFFADVVITISELLLHKHIDLKHPVFYY